MGVAEFDYLVYKAWNFELVKYPLNLADQAALGAMRFYASADKKAFITRIQTKGIVRDDFMSFVEKLLDIKANRQLGLRL